MLTRLRHRIGGESGISLVEMLVALFILAVALMGLASSILSSLTAIGNDERLVRATQLANQVVEDLRGMAWDTVGFYSGDAGYTATFDGQETVTLGTTRPAGADAPLPGPQTVTRDRVTYTVTTHISWQDDDPTVGPGGYEPTRLKAFHVQVEWTDRGTARSFETAGNRSPSVDEVPLVEAVEPPSGFFIATYDVSPTTVTIGPSGFTQQSILATVETSLPATSVVLEPSPLGALAMTPVPDSDGRQWTHLIAEGNGSFTPGNWSFEVSAYGVDGSATATRIVTFEQVGAYGPVVVQTPVLSPAAPICTASNSRTSVPVTLTFEVHGLLSPSDTARITWTDRNDGADATVVGPTDQGYLFEATIPTDVRLNRTTTTVTVTATRVETNTTASQPYVYAVSKPC